MAESKQNSGSDLFIVDNRLSGKCQKRTQQGLKETIIYCSRSHYNVTYNSFKYYSDKLLVCRYVSLESIYGQHIEIT